MTRAERRIIAARIRRRLHKLFAEYGSSPLFSSHQLYRRLRRNEGRRWGYSPRYFDRDYFVEGRQAKHRRELARLNEEYRLGQRGELDEPIL
ncbi:MAG: hypothetical protein QM758_20965 [Armatimonas sp.]